jgi:cytochrome c peroxidase
MRSPPSDYPVKPLVLNPSLKVPLPANLGMFVKDRKAALVLGKALFWDMQVGSDGIQACATCHFQAGADVRSKNQVAPQGNQVLYQRDRRTGYFFASSTKSDTFETVFGRIWESNFQLAGSDFPLVLTQNAFLTVGTPSGTIIAAKTGAGNRNDVVGSMGLMPAQFAGVNPGSPVDLFDTSIGLGTRRQTTGRNAPPSVNAVFNLLQFWDGRGDTQFNGFNPIGRHDPSRPKYFVNVGGTLQERILHMTVASLASQSVGPPLSDVEMSFAGRKWPDIGKKLTRVDVTPLAYQVVSNTDSVLGAHVTAAGKGLNSTYKALIQAAFKDELWNVDSQALRFPQAMLLQSTADETAYIPGPSQILDRSRADMALAETYTQMEANFSLFWGMAVMLYEAELVTEQSAFDKWMEGDANALTPKELDGLNVFVNQGKCVACHSGPEFTNATVRNTHNGQEQIEPILNASGAPAFYDNGFYNVGMTPTVDDIQRGAADPNGKPWGNSRQFLFRKWGVMDIPFSIIGLPIYRDIVPGDCTLNARNICDTGTFVTVVGSTKLFKVDPLGVVPPFLVCIDKDGDFQCGLKDQIVINRLDQDGNCKAATLRNVELNGPYFHNGGAATLQQVLDNYDIGGKFRKPGLNKVDMLPDIARLNLAAVTPASCAADPSACPWSAEEALVAFMVALTDSRVKNESQPFDHPQLFIPVDKTAPILDASGYAADPASPNAWLIEQAGVGMFQELPAMGAAGGSNLQPFLNLDPGAGDTGKGSIREDPSAN